MSSQLRAPPDDGRLPRIVASSIEVYVILDGLDRPGPSSYHEREGCFNAEDRVPWPVAIDHDAEPCGRCCESFDLDGDGR